MDVRIHLAKVICLASHEGTKDCELSRVIYVQPLGEFDPTERKVLDRTAEFLRIYFQLPVKIREGLSLDLIPATARREHPTWHVKQILCRRKERRRVPQTRTIRIDWRLTEFRQWWKVNWRGHGQHGDAGQYRGGERIDNIILVRGPVAGLPVFDSRPALVLVVVPRRQWSPCIKAKI